MRLVLVQPDRDEANLAESLRRLVARLRPLRSELEPPDVVLLPELVDLGEEPSTYEAAIRGLATDLGCHVVGGTHYRRQGDKKVQMGLAIRGDGAIVGEYLKLRPYADERRDVVPGTHPGEFLIGGRRAAAFICADLWSSDGLRLMRSSPELILVPALSISRRPAPDVPRALWRSLAVARAYEFAAFVAISDWAHPSRYGEATSSGVAGLADPSALQAESLFIPVMDDLRIYRLDFDALERLRRDQEDRGWNQRMPIG